MSLSNLPLYFQTRIQNAEGCWSWTGHLNPTGYGVASMAGGKTALAHRTVYEMVKGEIPGDLTVDHLCRNKSCVNPSHMEIVTRGENTRRAMAAKTTCANGHLLEGANIRLLPTPSGGKRRRCKLCESQRSRSRRIVPDGYRNEDVMTRREAAGVLGIDFTEVDDAVQRGLIKRIPSNSRNGKFVLPHIQKKVPSAGATA